MGGTCLRAGDSAQDLPKHQKPEPDSPMKAHSYSTEGISINDFDLIKVLGRGAFGKVYLVQKKETTRKYAMKVINKFDLGNRNRMMHTKNERNILAESSCPFIVTLKYSFQSSTQLFLVMEYMEGGNLLKHIKHATKFDEEVACFIAAEVLLAIEYLHSQGFIYRDLKPENVLVSPDGHIKLTDFGLSKTGVKREGMVTFSIIGTPGYTAPEILKDIGHDRGVDFWSFGVMLFEMLTGTCPFIPTQTDNIDLMFNALMKSDLVIPDYMSRRAADLIEKLLVKTPSQRLTNISKIRQHAFFENIDWVNLVQKKVNSPYKVPTGLVGTDDLSYWGSRDLASEEVPTLDSMKKHELYVKNYTFFGDDNEAGRTSSRNSVQNRPALGFLDEPIAEEENETSMALGDDRD
mmetsp:Transcript_3715/g.7956  ORF Transcript_3715/g.7956 Transcript_3715/m.7956 type:complete len:405 (-) Transcript_3715:45-1259(-)